MIMKIAKNYQHFNGKSTKYSKKSSIFIEKTYSYFYGMEEFFFGGKSEKMLSAFFERNPS